MLRSQGITFRELGHQGCKAALASIKGQGFMREEASSELGCRGGCQGYEGNLASLVAQAGFMREEASLELSCLAHRGALASFEVQIFMGEGGGHHWSKDVDDTNPQ